MAHDLSGRGFRDVVVAEFGDGFSETKGARGHQGADGIQLGRSFLYFGVGDLRYAQDMSYDDIIAIAAYHLDNMVTEFTFYDRRDLPFFQAESSGKKDRVP